MTVVVQESAPVALAVYAAACWRLRLDSSDEVERAWSLARHALASRLRGRPPIAASAEEGR